MQVMGSEMLEVTLFPDLTGFEFGPGDVSPEGTFHPPICPFTSSSVPSLPFSGPSVPSLASEGQIHGCPVILRVSRPSKSWRSSVLSLKYMGQMRNGLDPPCPPPIAFMMQYYTCKEVSLSLSLMDILSCTSTKLKKLK